MNSNSQNAEYTRQLASVYSRIAELKVEEADIVESAKDAGINTIVLRKVAKEMVMDTKKLAKRFDDEEQIDLFRDEVGVRQRVEMGMAAE